MTDDSPVEEVMNELEESMPDATVEVKSFHTPMRAVQVGYHHDTDDCSAVLDFTGQVHVGNPTQYHWSNNNYGFNHTGF